mmetsp:Transcript_28640/g.60737  ORF Transcript_28640/g.60737 Transcript_28640/m.60737 type:complete len:217 (-) Transcript_28640:3741-4391(-)
MHAVPSTAVSDHPVSLQPAMRPNATNAVSLTIPTATLPATTMSAKRHHTKAVVAEGYTAWKSLRSLRPGDGPPWRRAAEATFATGERTETVGPPPGSARRGGVNPPANIFRGSRDVVPIRNRLRRRTRTILLPPKILPSPHHALWSLRMKVLPQELMMKRVITRSGIIAEMPVTSRLIPRRNRISHSTATSTAAPNPWLHAEVRTWRPCHLRPLNG